MGGFCMAGAVIWGWKDTYNERISIINWKNPIIFIALSLLLGINYSFSNKYLRLIITFFLLFIGNGLIFKKDIKSTLISTVATQAVGIIAELIFALSTLAYTTALPEQIQQVYFGSFITNGIISLLIIILSIVHLPNYIYQRINKKMSRRLYIQDLLLVLLLIISINVLFIEIYYQIPMIVLIIVNSIIMILYTQIIMNSKKVINDKLQVDEKYQKTTQSLNEYKKIVDDFHMESHETVTQMKNMKNIIKNKSDYNESYIRHQIERKSMLEKKIENDKKKALLFGIPLGISIQEKCELMKMYKIKYQFEIDKEVKVNDLIDIDTDTMLDINDIVNIFLDNAIDYVKKAGHGKVRIRIYKDKQFIKISIANTCKELIDIEKLGKNKYSTKGEKRGYGLMQVDNIINNNPKLLNLKKWSNGLFIQILEIKLERRQSYLIKQLINV